MIALAWFFFVVLSMIVASNQAFHIGPLSGLNYGLSTTTISTPTTSTTNVTNATAPTAVITASTTTDSVVKKTSLDDGRIVTTRVLGAMETEAVSVEDESLEEIDEEEEEDYPITAVKPPQRNGEQTLYEIVFETEADGGKGEIHRNRGGKGLTDDGGEAQSPLDPWSIVWYIGSFGGLVAFFLIVSCSEWCCRRGARPLSVPYTQRGEVINTQPVSESPPPPYHLFAPPPYDSVNYAEVADKSATGEKLDIYVITVPIHQATQLRATLPPSSPNQLQPPA